MTATPIARFRALLPGMPLPERAGRDALGTMPVRAARHCDAVAAASGYGWWLRPPIDFDLLFDGHRLWWSCAEAFAGWLPLEAAQFPGFAACFDAAAPEAARGYSAPFLTALPEGGMVQVWTGLLARTAPGWSLLLRSPVNLAGPAGAVAFEGIVEADLWGGPLFANFRLTRTDEPVPFRRALPFLQAVPVPQFAYGDAVLSATDAASGLDSLGEDDWAGWMRDVVEPSRSSDHRPGRYAAEVRRRRRSGGCPFHLGAGDAARA